MSAPVNKAGEPEDCGACLWWDQDNMRLKGNDDKGYCKRYPAGIPKDKTDYCGEFEARPVAKPSK